MKLLNLATPVTSQIAHKESEGEEFLKDFFEEVGIKYESQKPINGLKGDHKQYRIADFHLPQFEVYVEFLGLWNTSHCEEYKRKMEIYKFNNIPCVYLYPDNLGIIKYIFDKRIQVVLSNHSLKKQLHRYWFFKLKKFRRIPNASFSYRGNSSSCYFEVIYNPKYQYR